MTAKSVQEIYEEAGKPDRAIIRLSEPTKVWTGLRRSSVKTEFEAWITDKGTGYYISPKSFHAFYMPENVIEIIPVDTMELWRRAKIAKKYIMTGKTHGRELDNAFENYDGDEMCAALWRMALKSDKLREAIYKVWHSPESVERSFVLNAQKFEHLSDDELSKHAQETRMNRGNNG